MGTLFPNLSIGSRYAGTAIVRNVTALALLMFLTGCGITKKRDATDQLVLSDAVDKSISAIDFRPLSGRKVYLDTTYVRQIKGPGFVNADYITSSLRQQVVAAGCLLQDTPGDADLIVEARVGTLGSDGHQTTYGIPANNAFSTAAQVLPSSPSLPSLPELSVARRYRVEGAAKIAAFAYDRETRAPVWQSGMSQTIASAKDTWVLGAGPFQGGTIRSRTKFAGSDLPFTNDDKPGSATRPFNRPPVDYTAEVHFDEGWPLMGPGNGRGMLAGKKPESEQEADAEIAVVGYEKEGEPTDKANGKDEPGAKEAASAKTKAKPDEPKPST